MKSIMLALAALLCLGSVARADGNPKECYTKTIVVCPTHKPKKKAPVVLPPIVLRVPQECPPAVPEYRVVTRYVDRPVNHYYPVVMLDPFPAYRCREWKRLSLGVYGELGFGVRDPYFSGEVGLQLEVPRAYLGARVFSELQYGVGAQALVYVYRGDRVKVHVIDPGFLVTGAPFRLESDTDIQRRIDLILGAGVQVRLMCHLEFLADWRVNIPDPALLARNDGLMPCGPCASKTVPVLDARSAVGNAFAESQLKVGLLLHF